MLLNSFFTIAETISNNTHPDSFSVFATLNPSHPVFKGHFPGNPVVPGVCLIEMAKEIFAQTMGQNLVLQQAANIKFLAVVNPEVHPFLKFNLNFTREINGFKVKCQIYWNETVCLKLDGSVGNFQKSENL
ncbi:MAG: hypothetical protein M0R21_01885 [Lentimicrobiaceae bacterium]|jgi:3-hydroxyacyl-[acyl-carrier-protein] dehydratase|nr:hypothetical protein [Lentimicrobiaceae bacterium]